MQSSRGMIPALCFFNTILRTQAGAKSRSQGGGEVISEVAKLKLNGTSNLGRDGSELVDHRNELNQLRMAQVNMRHT
ncbi:hypothetical protein BM1_02110 [Bipolaris maydis]|nr:hypothetical protein BM1_02110 [Bipolaris maydis]